MRHLVLLFSAFLLLSSCGVKKTKTLLSSGEYDRAIDKSVSALRTNKDKKSKQEYVVILEDAFAKAKDRDLRNIDMLLKDANPENLEKVFSLYHLLNDRQEKIRPLLPLKKLPSGKQAVFVLDDYSEEIVNSKNALSKYLYNKATSLLLKTGKQDARKAYDELVYLDKINPNYKDVRARIEEAQRKGTEYVSIYMNNDTNVLIPKQLERELLEFSSGGLNDKWTVYHVNEQKGIDYTYGISVNFRQINISPEQVTEKEFISEKQVKVGTKKLLDARGREVRDSLGNVIMVDNMKLVKATVQEFRQFKAVQVAAKVAYFEMDKNQLLKSYPLSSEFIFEHIYAKVKGDKRALDKDYQINADRRAVPFPSNEQMVYDAGKDIKEKLRNIIIRNRIDKL